MHDKVSAMDHPRRKTHLNVTISGFFVKLGHPQKIIIWLHYMKIVSTHCYLDVKF